MITSDPWETSQSIRHERIKYKALDLDLWHPSIGVPDNFNFLIEISSNYAFIL